MCLSIPSQVVEVDEESHSVTVDTMGGVKREVSTPFNDRVIEY